MDVARLLLPDYRKCHLVILLEEEEKVLLEEEEKVLLEEEEVISLSFSPHRRGMHGMLHVLPVNQNQENVLLEEQEVLHEEMEWGREKRKKRKKEVLLEKRKKRKKRRKEVLLEKRKKRKKTVFLEEVISRSRMHCRLKDNKWVLLASLSSTSLLEDHSTYLLLKKKEDEEEEKEVLHEEEE
jgi:hypothetical protein